MKFRAKKDELFLFLTDRQLFVLEFRECFKIKKAFNIDELVSHPESFQKEFLSKEIRLLIIPDYWITIRFYPVATKKASVIESFLKRKLPMDFPDASDCKEFFEYSFYKQAEQQGVQVYVIQEELFYILYRNLFSSLSIEKITTPAFLWKAKLSKKIKDINKGLKIFIHIYQNSAYLCFFLESYFLFSRLISTEQDYIGQLSYELMQSFRLVSQKTKKEVEKIYLISRQDLDAEGLSERLEIEIVDVSDQVALSSPSLDVVEGIGSFAFLNRSDLLDSAKFFYLAYRPLKEIKEWAFFQNVGIGVGIFVFVFLLIEAIYLNSFIPRLHKNTPDINIPTIQEQISAIDDVLHYKERADLSLIIMKILNCTSNEIYLQHIGISSGPPYSIELVGNVSALSVKDFQKIFSLFLSNIKQSFKHSQIPSLADIDIKRAGEQGFKFRFGFEGNEGQI